MKKLFFALFFLPLAICAAPAEAQRFESPQEFFSKEKLGKSLQDYTGAKIDADGNFKETGTDGLINTINKVIPVVRIFLAVVATVLLIWAGVHLMITRGDETLYKEKKAQVLAIATGFLLIFMISPMLNDVFFDAENQLLVKTGDVNEVAELQSDDQIRKKALWGVTEMKGIFQYASTFVVVVGMVFLILSVFPLIFGGEDEAELTKVKKRVIFTVVGMGVFISAETAVELFATADGRIGAPDVRGAVSLAVKWANFLMGFIGLFAILALVWAGFRLIANFGDESATEEAKKIAVAAVIGLVLTFSSWTAVNFFLNAGNVPDEENKAVGDGLF